MMPRRRVCSATLLPKGKSRLSHRPSLSATKPLHQTTPPSSLAKTDPSPLLKRPSTANREDKWATPAGWRRSRATGSRSRTLPGTATLSYTTVIRTPLLPSNPGWLFPRTWTERAGSPSCGTTRRPTSCTPCCGRPLASTWSSGVPRLPPSGFVST